MKQPAYPCWLLFHHEKFSHSGQNKTKNKTLVLIISLRAAQHPKPFVPSIPLFFPLMPSSMLQLKPRNGHSTGFSLFPLSSLLAHAEPESQSVSSLSILVSNKPLWANMLLHALICHIWLSIGVVLSSSLFDGRVSSWAR